MARGGRGSPISYFSCAPSAAGASRIIYCGELVFHGIYRGGRHSSTSSTTRRSRYLGPCQKLHDLAGPSRTLWSSGGTGTCGCVFLTAGFLGMLFTTTFRESAAPIFSYRLSIPEFLGVVFFYMWAEIAPLHYTALPHWVQTLRYDVSVMLLGSVLASARQLLCDSQWPPGTACAMTPTLRFMDGGRRVLRGSPPSRGHFIPFVRSTPSATIRRDSRARARGRARLG